MFKISKIILSLTLFIFAGCYSEEPEAPPNIILIMTDDQGWGQTGYYNHPVLETPNLDKMAENGIRFDRFYAGAPVCSPTRASVLTGRNNDRTGVYTHGNALRKQEQTISEALKQSGYATGHFGKWHINGLVGPGVPILEDDPYGPGVFGFDEWVSVTNFFDIDPLMSDNGRFKEYEGTSSDIADRNSGEYQLYNLADDPKETTDVSAKYPEKFKELKSRFTEFDASVKKSIEGKDYPEGKLTDKPYRQGWMTDPRYEPYLEDWLEKWEYRDRILREKGWKR